MRRRNPDLLSRRCSRLGAPSIALALAALLLTGCGLSPTYSLRVENQSSSTVLARIERRPSMNNAISLQSARVGAGSSAELGPVEAPPLERVYIVISDPNEMHALPESHKISRGDWVVTVSKGSMSSWGPYEISVSKR